MTAAFQVLIGVVVGVFLASNSPEAAEHIREVTITLMNTIKGVI